MIVGLHHAQITVPPDQVSFARTFYCGILQLPEIPKPKNLQGRGGFWFQVGDHNVHVGTEDGVDRTLTKAHLAYEVTDLSRWRQRIEQFGLSVHNGIPLPGYDRFEFRDPFGNRVELLQKLLPTTEGTACP